MKKGILVFSVFLMSLSSLSVAQEDRVAQDCDQTSKAFQARLDVVSKRLDRAKKLAKEMVAAVNPDRLQQAGTHLLDETAARIYHEHYSDLLIVLDQITGTVAVETKSLPNTPEQTQAQFSDLLAPDERGIKALVDARLDFEASPSHFEVNGNRCEFKSIVELSEIFVHEAVHTFKDESGKQLYGHLFEIPLTNLARAISYVWQSGSNSLDLIVRPKAPIPRPEPFSMGEENEDPMVSALERLGLEPHKIPSRAERLRRLEKRKEELSKPRYAIQLNTLHLNTHDCARMRSSAATSFVLMDSSNAVVGTYAPNQMHYLDKEGPYTLSWGTLNELVTLKDGAVLNVSPQMR